MLVVDAGVSWTSSAAGCGPLVVLQRLRLASLMGAALALKMPASFLSPASVVMSCMWLIYCAKACRLVSKRCASARGARPAWSRSCEYKVQTSQRVSSDVGITWDEGVPGRQPADEGCHSRLCLKELQLICQPYGPYPAVVGVMLYSDPAMRDGPRGLRLHPAEEGQQPLHTNLENSSPGGQIATQCRILGERPGSASGCCRKGLYRWLSLICQTLLQTAGMFQMAWLHAREGSALPCN